MRIGFRLLASKVWSRASGVSRERSGEERSAYTRLASLTECFLSPLLRDCSQATLESMQIFANGKQCFGAFAEPNNSRGKSLIIVALS